MLVVSGAVRLLNVYVEGVGVVDVEVDVHEIQTDLSDEEAVEVEGALSELGGPGIAGPGSISDQPAARESVMGNKNIYLFIYLFGSVEIV